VERNNAENTNTNRRNLIAFFMVIEFSLTFIYLTAVIAKFELFFNVLFEFIGIKWNLLE